MADFAELDTNNIVINTERVAKEDCSTNNVIDEAKGVEFLNNIHGKNSVWKLYDRDMSENVNNAGRPLFRKNTAKIGGSYDTTRDAFIESKPYNSWTLNETTCSYRAPIDEPSYNNQFYQDNGTTAKYLINWDEDNQRWLATGSSNGSTYLWNAQNQTWSLLT